MKAKLIIGMLLLSMVVLSGCLGIFNSEEVKIHKDLIGNRSCWDACVCGVEDVGGSEIKSGRVEGEWCVCYNQVIDDPCCDCCNNDCNWGIAR